MAGDGVYHGVVSPPRCDTAIGDSGAAPRGRDRETIEIKGNGGGCYLEQLAPGDANGLFANL
jgi:hypothetical protein